jgi:hypothetical protein
VSEKPRYLNKAIEHYERGMMLDLNDYYPSCNLPMLYRERRKRGDEDRARAAATVARLACERAIRRGTDDAWTRPTLLGVAFFEADLEAVDELCEQVATEGPARWQLASMIEDLDVTGARTEDAVKRTGLELALGKLKALLPPSAEA